MVFGIWYLVFSVGGLWWACAWRRCVRLWLVLVWGSGRVAVFVCCFHVQWRLSVGWRRGPCCVCCLGGVWLCRPSVLCYRGIQGRALVIPRCLCPRQPRRVRGPGAGAAPWCPHAAVYRPRGSVVKGSRVFMAGPRRHPLFPLPCPHRALSPPPGPPPGGVGSVV